MTCRNLVRFGVAVMALRLLGASAEAVNTTADWAGAGNTGVEGNVNNYTVLTPLSVGGVFQDVVPVGPGGVNFADFHLGDQTLSTPGGVLDFRNELHMSGTMTFSNPNTALPNLLFGWYDKDNTNHRIGLGFANSTTAPEVPKTDYLRIDLGFATTSVPNPNPPPTNIGNYFTFVSANGMPTESNFNSVLPNGTYPFTFDYIPGPAGMAGGSMSATVGDFFHVTQPIGVLNPSPGVPGTLAKPWDTDFFEFDSFGFVQRTRTNPPGQGVSYSLTISNVTYTGGTAAGDTDGDQDVDGTDLAAVTSNFATGTSLATGDVDGDGDTDGNDFLIVQQGLGTVPAVPVTTAIPEPSAIVLLAISGVAAGVHQGRRRPSVRF